jgi:prefoldin beta subunit
MVMVSKDVQNLLVEAQSCQQQLQMVMTQKETLNHQLLETTKALEELSKPGKEPVYKITGPVMIKVDRLEASKDLESKKELAMMRVKSMQKSESQLKEQLEEFRERLSKAGV